MTGETSGKCRPKPVDVGEMSAAVRSYSTRQSPLYHNCKLQAPDGQLLCTCDEKKANWYMDKELGGTAFTTFCFDSVAIWYRKLTFSYKFDLNDIRVSFQGPKSSSESSFEHAKLQGDIQQLVLKSRNSYSWLVLVALQPFSDVVL